MNWTGLEDAMEKDPARQRPGRDTEIPEIPTGEGGVGVGVSWYGYRYAI